MDWKLQSTIAIVGGIVVLIVGAGYKSYKLQDLPTPKESGITFFVGTVFTAVLSFMGGFDTWAKDIQDLVGVVSGSATVTTPPSNEFSGMVEKVGDSMKSVSSWFQRGSVIDDDDMIVGMMPS